MDYWEKLSKGTFGNHPMRVIQVLDDFFRVYLFLRKEGKY